MAMLITKFHKLIQSKLVWIAFLVVVVFAFVIWGMAVPNTRDRRVAMAPGFLDGEPVDPAVFRQAYFGTYLSVVLALGRAIDITPEIDEQLRKAAWQRLAALRAADRMGIVVGDDEVARTIQQHEGFSSQGRFNVAAYKAFVQNFLARFGFSERQFEEHVREEIKLQKIRSLMERASLVTPYEMKRAFHSLTDRFQADYVILNAALVEKDVSVDEAAARRFYEENRERFTEPERVRVRFVRISALPFIPRVKVTDDEIQAYYDENLTNFIDRSAAESADAETGAVERLTRYLPLEEVRQTIVNRLALRKALDEAGEKAMNFVIDLTPGRDGEAPSFEEAAARAELKVETLPPFSREDDLPGIENPRAFRAAAFELTPGSDSYFSNPVTGSNEVYVIALKERIPSRVPEFEEVKEKALQAARRAAIIDALQARAQQFKTDAENALLEKIDFREFASFYGLTVHTTAVFSATTGLPDLDDDLAGAILSAVLTLNAGEVSEPSRVDEGFLVVYARERIPSESISFDAARRQLIESLRRQIGRHTFDRWQAYALKKANFVDRRATPAETEEEENEAKGG